MATNLIATQSIPRGLMRQSFAATISRLFPQGGAPLFGLTSLIPDANVLSFEHGYWTKIMSFPKLVVANGAAATVAGNVVKYFGMVTEAGLSLTPEETQTETATIKLGVSGITGLAGS